MINQQGVWKMLSYERLAKQETAKPQRFEIWFSELETSAAAHHGHRQPHFWRM